jgi:putative alpha-1,2-mannosidase
MVASPFFERVSIRLPSAVNTGGRGGEEHTLVISARDAPIKPFVKSLKIDGVPVSEPVLRHQQIVNARSIEFEMDDQPQDWGSWSIVNKGMDFMVPSTRLKGSGTMVT